jgi:MFS family permease
MVLGSLAERIGSWPVLGLGTLGLLLGSVLMIIGTAWSATSAVLIFGLATAPIYPLLILTTPQRTSRQVSDRVVGYQTAASAVGAAGIPFLVGTAMGESVTAFAPAIGALCVAAAILQLAMRGLLRRRSARD